MEKICPGRSNVVFRPRKFLQRARPRSKVTYKRPILGGTVTPKLAGWRARVPDPERAFDVLMG